MRVFAVACALALSLGCRSNADPFFRVTVNCAKVSFDTTATPAVVSCLEAAVPDPAPLNACLTGIVTKKQASVEEVACAVTWVSQRENANILADRPVNLKLRNLAIDWVVGEGISIRNTYEGE